MGEAVVVQRLSYLALVMVVLSACGGPDTSDAPDVATAAAVEGSSTAIEDCGTFELSQKNVDLPEDAATCFIDAAQAGRPARLKVTRPTTEGDPITSVYEAGVDGGVEVVRDSRQDRFGEQNVSRRTCTGPVSRRGLIDFAQCSEPTPVES
ncbi:uncharacterized protein DUF4362 [Micromonospora pisi]|uniref:Uncharacterized protein DUF4362 n=1 Tax=Micromonospora pisi TaxID=589240 RepID=A0A495JIP7_9ACTN|nr:DUF4362 domain-containing protein [Micromonospora pisi]RKR88906.1 uncharacterized protein DUF4362 [Micromonospora pisi]